VIPDAALARQIECYRQKRGEERLAVALGLQELSCAITRQGFATVIRMPIPPRLKDCCVGVSSWHETDERWAALRPLLGHKSSVSLLHSSA
jgi:hypothetical protein